MYGFFDYQAADVMTPRPVVIGPRTQLADAEAIIAEYDFDAVPVVEHEDQLLGTLTKLDLLKALALNRQSMISAYDETMDQSVERAMTRPPLTVAPDTPLIHVLRMMVDTRHKSLPVVEGHRLVGIVACEDILRVLRGTVPGEPPERSRQSPHGWAPAAGGPPH